jgi:arylsulfatase A-like enzyme
LDDPYGHAQGFERFTTTPNPDRLWHADEVTERGVALLDKLRGDGRPYFLWLHYLDPHHPYAPHPSLGRLAPDGAPWGEAPQRRYQAELAWTDRHLGAFLDHARASGALDEALLLVHSDHGEGFREHGYEYHGQSLYEDQIRVLLLARAPGLPAARVEAPTMLLDLFPTLLHLASGQAPSEPPLGRGRSLAPLLAGAPPDLARPIFSEMRSDTRRSDLKALRQGRWKLIHDLRADRWEWFDLAADPREAKPLPPSHDPATFERLQGLLRRFEAETIRTIPAR